MTMMPTIRLGSLGEPVKALQSALNRWRPSNLSSVDVDGFFGLRTNSKVREYQSANELAPDGVVGPLTWESLRPLLEHVAGSIPPPANDLAAGARIVLAHGASAPTASPTSRVRAAAARAWTATPSARWTSRRRARSA
jgi:peptidoglycan hydrolase-like protein with peptidoglycan-binding domain